jgi:hypothetical protein
MENQTVTQIQQEQQILKVEGGQVSKETTLEYFLIRYNSINVSF